jgi:hypothetical protein
MLHWLLDARAVPWTSRPVGMVPALPAFPTDLGLDPQAWPMVAGWGALAMAHPSSDVAIRWKSGPGATPVAGPTDMGTIPLPDKSVAYRFPARMAPVGQDGSGSAETTCLVREAVIRPSILDLCQSLAPTIGLALEHSLGPHSGWLAGGGATTETVSRAAGLALVVVSGSS